MAPPIHPILQFAGLATQPAKHALAVELETVSCAIIPTSRAETPAPPLAYQASESLLIPNYVWDVATLASSAPTLTQTVPYANLQAVLGLFTTMITQLFPSV